MDFKDEMLAEMKKISSMSYTRGFSDGIVAILDVLEGAMRASNSNVVYAKWLETAREELNKWNEEKLESTK